MIPGIKSLKPLDNYILHVVFDDGKEVVYDVKDDIDKIESYKNLKNIYGLFQQVQSDQSRTCVFEGEEIDLPSDVIYEHGEEAFAIQKNGKNAVSRRNPRVFCDFRYASLTKNTSRDIGYE